MLLSLICGVPLILVETLEEVLAELCRMVRYAWSNRKVAS